MTDLAATLKLIAAQAPGLCKAGVRSIKLTDVKLGAVSIGDLELQFGEPEPPPPRPPTKAELAAARREQAPIDPLDDPMTYPGGRVPRLPDRTQLKRPQNERDEHEDDDDEDDEDAEIVDAE